MALKHVTALYNDGGGTNSTNQPSLPPTSNNAQSNTNNNQFNIFDWDGDGESFEWLRGTNSSNENTPNYSNNNLANNQPYQLSQPTKTYENITTQSNYSNLMTSSLNPDIFLSAEAVENITSNLNSTSANAEETKPLVNNILNYSGDLEPDDLQTIYECSNRLNGVEQDQQELNTNWSATKNIIYKSDPLYGINNLFSTSTVESINTDTRSLFDWDGDGESFEWLNFFNNKNTDNVNGVENNQTPESIVTETSEPIIDESPQPIIVETPESTVEVSKTKDISELAGYVSTVTVNEEYNYSTHLFELDGTQILVDVKGGTIDEDAIITIAGHGGHVGNLFHTTADRGYIALEENWLNREYTNENAVITIRQDRGTGNGNMIASAQLATQFASEFNVSSENYRIVVFSAGYSQAIHSANYLYEQNPELKQLQIYLCDSWDNSSTPDYGPEYKVSDAETQLLADRGTIVYAIHPRGMGPTDEIYAGWVKSGMNVFYIQNMQAVWNKYNANWHNHVETDFYKDYMDYITADGTFPTDTYVVQTLNQKSNGWETINIANLEGKTEQVILKEQGFNQPAVHLEAIPETEQTGQW